jgi:hypothetical protein
MMLAWIVELPVIDLLFFFALLVAFIVVACNVLVTESLDCRPSLRRAESLTSSTHDSEARRSLGTREGLEGGLAGPRQTIEAAVGRAPPIEERARPCVRPGFLLSRCAPADSRVVILLSRASGLRARSRGT